MVQLSGNEAYALVLTLSWTLGFLPRFLGRKDLTWVQCVGIALVVHPFVRMGVGFLRTYELLFVPTVLEPASPIQLWRSVENQVWYNLMLPLLGLFLLHAPFRDTRAGEARHERFRDVLAHHGVAPRAGIATDVTRALSLFLLLAALLAAAWVASRYVTGILNPGSDESAYWRNITIPLILLLGLAPGLGEEFLFRGLLLTSLARRMPWIAAALVQALAFSLIHAGYGTFTHLLGPFLFGLAMAFVARELGIVVAALLHAQANVVFFTIEVAPTYLAVHGALGLAALLAVTGALVVASAWALHKTKGDAIRILLTRGFRLRPTAEPSPDAGP